MNRRFFFLVSNPSRVKFVSNTKILFHSPTCTVVTRPIIQINSQHITHRQHIAHMLTVRSAHRQDPIVTGRRDGAHTDQTDRPSQAEGTEHTQTRPIVRHGQKEPEKQCTVITSQHGNHSYKFTTLPTHKLTTLFLNSAQTRPIVRRSQKEQSADQPTVRHRHKEQCTDRPTVRHRHKEQSADQPSVTATRDGAHTDRSSVTATRNRRDGAQTD
jgi:hypothetical protein